MTKTISPSVHTTRWFFLILSALALGIFFWMIKSFILALITAGVFAVILSPVQRKLLKYVKYERLAAVILVIAVFSLVLVPAFVAGVFIAQEAGEIVSTTIAEDGWLQSLDVKSHPWFIAMPTIVQERVLEIDFIEAGRGAADWTVRHLGDVLNGGVRIILNTMIFFVALFYFIVYRKTLRKQVLALSPFKNKLDKEIIDHMVKTVRDVVFGALILAVIQSVLASIGLTIFGVPGALFLGALALIAAQIPMVGISLIMVPSVIYLLVTGQPGAALGLLIWAVVAVGLADNILSPIIIGGRTKMPELLILISILGGLSVFGAIGFIVGPTVLALVLVLLNLYKQGILEKKSF